MTFKSLQIFYSKMVTISTHGNILSAQMVFIELYRRSYHKAILVYKCLHSLVPNYFLNYFKKFSNVHSYNTRHKNRLILPKVKYNFGKNTFIFSGVQVYNMLPDHVMKAESIPLN